MSEVVDFSVAKQNKDASKSIIKESDTMKNTPINNKFLKIKEADKNK